ncbi:MAG TPA: hypothetical protein VIT92_14700 [Burkholderiaceae bacterium]
MRDLFLSECRRFKHAALIFAGVHLLLQLFVNRMANFYQWGWQFHTLALGLFMLAGLGFALYQFGTYRQPSRWVWLLHRPLARHLIFAGIACASLALIAFAVGVPGLLAVLISDALTERTIDARHYLMPVQAALFTAIAWLAGTYVILNRSRSAIVVMVLPFLLLAHLAAAWTMVAMAALCALLMAYIAYGSFKPNRMTPPESLPATVATAAPLQIGFYFALLWLGSLTFQYGAIFLGLHPNNTQVPPAGGYTEAVRADSGRVLALGLAAATDPRAAHWSRQMALLKPVEINPELRQYAVRHQLSNLYSTHWIDETRNIGWTFSHDAMRFEGHDMNTGHRIGWLGTGGLNDAGRFSTPMLPYTDTDLLGPQDLYRHDPATQKLRHLVHLSGGEQLISGLRKAGNLHYLVTSKRLIAYADEAGAAGPLTERGSIALPAPARDLARVDIADLLDGRLVSFTYGDNMLLGEGDAAQFVYQIGQDDRPVLVAQRALGHDFPLLFEHKDWWLSPVIYSVLALPDALLEKGKVLAPGAAIDTTALTRARPPAVWAAAFVAALLAALAAWWWLRRTTASAARKTGWIAACLLLGPASLLCMTVLEPRTAHPHTHPSRPVPDPAALPA